VLLGSGAPCQLQTLARQEHGRTIPLGETYPSVRLALSVAKTAEDRDRAHYAEVVRMNCSVAQRCASSEDTKIRTEVAAIGWGACARSGIDRIA
jgi:hypothetical protein